MAQAKTFSVTIKQDLEEAEALLRANPDNFQYICFQEEQPSDGQRHLQGMVQFHQRKSLNQAYRILANLGLKDIHVEKARVVNALYEYVHKKLTRVENGIHIETGDFQGEGRTRRDEDGDPIVRYNDVIQYFEEGGSPDQIIRALGPNVLKIPFRTIHKELLAMKRDDAKKNRIQLAEQWWKDTAYAWQLEAREILTNWSAEEQDRKILVIYDPQGNHGKTVLCKQLQDTNPDEIAYIKKSKVDNMSLLLKNYEELKYCLVDYTRDDEKYGSPKFLESLKDGVVQSNKYQSEIIRFPNVQVAVMTNKPLDWSTLTKDRWHVVELEGTYAEPVMKPWSEEKFDAAYKASILEDFKPGEKRPIERVTGDEFGVIYSSRW